MRVIYFSLDYTPHDHRFLSALSTTEHEVYYVRLQRGARQVEDRPVPMNIKQVQWAGGKGEFRWSQLPRLVWDFKRLIRQINPDLVHAGPIQDAGLIAALSGFHPLLIMSWGFDLMQDVDRNGIYRRITRYVLRRASAFVSDCEATRQRAIEIGIPLQKTVVFPWGVDLGLFQPGKRIIPKNKKRTGYTLICNRSWEPRYGVDVMAKAFVKVAQFRDDVDLLLLGDGSMSAEIRRIFSKGRVEALVTYGGRVPQSRLLQYYHMVDLFISPSHVDGSSVSLLEAFACGMPVVVSDIPANCEWVTENKNGWLFPDGDSDELAKKILVALENPSKMQEMGRAARVTAEARADWQKNFPKLLDAYRMAVVSRKE